MKFGDHTNITDVAIPRNYADATARTAALPAPELNQMTTLTTAPGVVQTWNGSAWVALGGSGGALPAGGTTGQTLIKTSATDYATTWRDAPGAELQYTEITTGVTITATSNTTPDVCITGAALTFDGTTSIMVEVFSYSLSTPAQQGGEVSLYVWDGATNLGRVVRQGGGGTATNMACVCFRMRVTPTAGSHTFSVRGTVNISSGILGAGAAPGQSPAYLRITRA
jgi:hypothetical protein